MGSKLMVIAALTSALALSGCGGGSSSTDNNNIPAPSDTTSQVTFESNSIAMDKAYVPSLFYSNITSANAGLTADAGATLTVFDNRWQQFKTAHRYRYGYSIWESRFPLIDANIKTAADFYAAVASYPADLTPAHNELEAVRDTLGTMRSSAGITWFMDTVTGAHHAMEPVAGAAKLYTDSAKTPADLNALKTALATSLPTFQTEWNKLVSAYGNGSTVKALYSLSDDKALVLSNNITAMTQILTDLATALANNDDATIIDRAGKVKPKFVMVFLAFGDFITPFTSDIIAANKAFIAALYCTNNPPDAATACLNGQATALAGTKAHLDAFATAFSDFGAHFPVSSSMNLPGALGWTTKMAELQTNLQSAITEVQTAINNSGTLADVALAHGYLENVRNAFYYICTTYEGHHTMMSRLTEYHHYFEKSLLDIVLDLATLQPKASLTSEEMQAVANAMTGLQVAFDNMSAAALTLDKSAWGMQSADLEPLLTAQQNNINDLQAALTANDDVTTIARAVDVKKKFIPFFKAFGNF